MLIKFNVPRLLAWLMLVCTMVACTQVKKLQYLQGDLPNNGNESNYQEPVIQPGDLLSIIVFSDNPTASAAFNQPMFASINSGTGGNVTIGNLSQNNGHTSLGYLVDQSGNIQFQSLGNLKVSGLTKAQLANVLDSSLRKYLNNPYFNIRFMNFRVTVMGDVARPSTYMVPSERINVLEAIGLAGDLNVTARRDNVLIIREVSGRREFGRLDLTKPEIFNSAFFQLKQGDVVIIDVTKNKAAQGDQIVVRNITLGASILSTIAIIFSVLRN